LVFGDGYGAEIRMGGGSIRLSAPGDVMLDSGRNVMAWSGRDVILKARENIDATTSEKDIRIKAEQNIKMLAANNEGPHHILLECRASQPGTHYGAGCGEIPEEYDDNVVGPGIILNTQKSEIIGLANNVYMRATTNAEATSSVPNGVIALDAPSTNGVIRTFSKHFINTVRCSVNHFFAETPAGANYFTSQYTSIGSSCNYINGALHTRNDILTGGYLYGQRISTIDCQFTKITNQQLVAAVTPHYAWHQAPSGALMTWYSIDLLNNWQQGWGTASGDNKLRPGYSGAVPTKSFAFRDAEKYCSEEFVLVENRWMSMARSDSSDITEPWIEKAVEDKDDNETWPFPGITHESGSDKWYYIYDNVLYDHEKGISKDSDDAGYTDAEFGVLDEQVFNEKYLAIAMCSEEETEA